MTTTDILFSQRLESLRKERGIKRQKAADDIGISRASLEYYEKGKRKPDIKMLLKLCRFYKVSADYLIGLSNAQITATDDEYLKLVCDYTGFSEKTINSLAELSERTINSLIEINKKLPELKLSAEGITVTIKFPT